MGCIKPGAGIEDDKVFWRLAFQLAQGMADLHRGGLTQMIVRVCRVLV